MSERNARGLGRFFGGEDSPEVGIGVSAPRDGEYQQTIAALRARVAELESSAGRPSFIDLDDDTLTQIAAEDAARRAAEEEAKRNTPSPLDTALAGPVPEPTTFRSMP